MEESLRDGDAPSEQYHYAEPIGVGGEKVSNESSALLDELEKQDTLEQEHLLRNPKQMFAELMATRELVYQQVLEIRELRRQIEALSGRKE